MDNIATQLQQLASIKSDLASVITTYGGEVPEGFDNYAAAFSSLLENAGGGGGGGGGEEPGGEFSITPRLYLNLTGNEYEECSNSEAPITSLPAPVYDLTIEDNTGNYLTDSDCTVGDMSGYVSVVYDGEDHRWLLCPFPNWTAESIEESGIPAADYITIDIEYYDPNTGESVYPTVTPMLYYDFSGLLE